MQSVCYHRALILLTIIAILLCNCFCALLEKKYTLKIPVLLPIGGPIAPLGSMCTKGVELLMAKINNQSRLLPDYNLVADMIDDRCMDDHALAHILPFFMRENSLLANNEQIGEYVIPANMTSKLDQETVYVPPLLIGGMCSAVCKVVALYAQHFDIINSQEAFINFVKIMGWTKVAVVSDGSLEMFKITSDAIAAYHRANIAIIAGEFYDKDPTEAMVRIAVSGARVIVVNCYFDTCTAVACQGYANGLYDAHVIWFFPGSIDLLRLGRPDGCTLEMVAAIDANTLYFNQLKSNYSSTATSIGITGDELDNYLDQAVINVTQHPFWDARSMCFDNVQPAVFILDKVEKTLNSKNQTLRDVIVDNSRKGELGEIVRQGVETLDIRAFASRIRYEPGEMEMLVPTGYTQAQNGRRVFVFVDNGVEAVNRDERYQFPTPFIWKTKDGKPPSAEIATIHQEKRASSGAVIFLSILAGIIAFVAVFLLGLHQYQLRNNSMGVNNGKEFPVANDLILMGIVFLLSAVVIYPADGRLPLTMREFCWTAPPLVISGYCLVMGSLLLKLTHRSNVIVSKTVQNVAMSRMLKTTNTNRAVSTSKQSTNANRNYNLRKTWFNSTRRRFFSFSVWVVANMALIGMWYCLEGSPTTCQVVVTYYDKDTDTLHNDIWEACSSNGGGGQNAFYAILGLQGVCLIVGFFLSVMKRQENGSTIGTSTGEQASDVRCVYIVFPSAIAAVLTVGIATRPDVIYYFVACIILFECFGVVFVLFASKHQNYAEFMARQAATVVNDCPFPEAGTSYQQTSYQLKVPRP